MPEDEDRFFETENINPAWGEWKIKYISWTCIKIISYTSTYNIKTIFNFNITSKSNLWFSFICN